MYSSVAKIFPYSFPPQTEYHPKSIDHLPMLCLTLCLSHTRTQHVHIHVHVNADTTHTHTYTHMHTHAHTHTHLHIHVHIHLYTHNAHTHTLKYTHTWTHTHNQTHTRTHRNIFHPHFRLFSSTPFSSFLPEFYFSLLPLLPSIIIYVCYRACKNGLRFESKCLVVMHDARFPTYTIYQEKSLGC